MIGILVEKPSFAKAMSNALGGMSGTYHNEKYQIVAARGHLLETTLDMKQQVKDKNKLPEYESWDKAYLGWNSNDLYFKKKPKKDTSAVLNNIKTVLSSCDEIIIATDVDPSGEGQMIAWEILEYLNLHRKKVTRMYFYDETIKSLQKAFVDRVTLPKMEDDGEFLKADYRNKWDFMSMQWTRLAGNFVRKKKTIRQGRLKSVMVKIVGDMYSDYINYKKVPFYTNKFKDENGNIFASKQEPLYPKKEDVVSNYKTATVVVDEKTIKKQAPPKLLDLATLASKLSKKGYKASEVLDAYQKMYECRNANGDGIVSYPRTDDKLITSEQFQALLPYVDKIANVVGIDPKLISHRTERFTHIMKTGAHGANRPGANVPSSLDELTQFGKSAPEIYKLLALNYLAMMMPDYEYQTEKAHLQEYPIFVSTISVPVKQGYKEIYNDNDDEDEKDVKSFGKQAIPFIHEGFPPRPKHPTMSLLMKQLEKYDVGTGATRTSTYANVTDTRQENSLLKETKGKLTLTEYGQISYELTKDSKIADPLLTEKVYKEMEEVEKKTLKIEDGLSRISDLIKYDTKVFEENRKKMNVTEDMPVSYEKKDKFTMTFKGKQVEVNAAFGSHKFTDDEIAKLKNGDIITFQAISQNGKPYTATGCIQEFKYKGKKCIGFQFLKK